LLVTDVVLPTHGASAAPLPQAWCGTDELSQDRPDFVAANQVHVVYAYPIGATDRFWSVAPQIARDLAGVDTWWRSQDPTRTPRFDLVDDPACPSQFGTLDLSSVAVAGAAPGEVQPAGNVSAIVGQTLNADGFNDDTKKYLVYYDGPIDSELCGLSRSSSTVGGPDRISLVFMQGPPGCVTGGWGSGTGWTARTAAHELLHAFNDPFAPGTAPNACPDQGHVCDSQADILSTGTNHPSPTLTDAVLDVNHDDYYDHPGSWWDIRNSPWLVHLEVPPALLTIAVDGGAGGQVVTVPGGAVCAQTCTQRFDGNAVAHLSAVPKPGYKLLRWGGACAGLAEACDATVTGDRTVVNAVFGPAAVVQGRVRGPGVIEVLGSSPCAAACSIDLVPGAAVQWVAVPGAHARFVGWRGLCNGPKRRCTVVVASGARHPHMTAVFRAVSTRSRRRQREI
jgi:hypothetical protein